MILLRDVARIFSALFREDERGVAFDNRRNADRSPA